MDEAAAALKARARETARAGRKRAERAGRGRRRSTCAVPRPAFAPLPTPRPPGCKGWAGGGCRRGRAPCRGRGGRRPRGCAPAIRAEHGGRGGRVSWRGWAGFMDVLGVVERGLRVTVADSASLASLLPKHTRAIPPPPNNPTPLYPSKPHSYAAASRLRDALAAVDKRMAAAAGRAARLAELAAGSPALRLGQRVTHAALGYRGAICGCDTVGSVGWAGGAWEAGRVAQESQRALWQAHHAQCPFFLI